MWHPRPTLLRTSTSPSVCHPRPTLLETSPSVWRPRPTLLETSPSVWASSADPDIVVIAGVVSREECGDSVVIPSDCVYDDYFNDGQYDDCPDYYDYDDPDDYGSL